MFLVKNVDGYIKKQKKRSKTTKMKILIDTPTKEDIEKIVYHMKTFCIENFREFKLYIDEELKFEQKIKDEK